MIDHLKIVVSDVARSRAFYERALEPLGYRVMLEPAPGVVGMGVETPDFWFAAAGLEAGPIAPAHVAFRAETRSVIHAFHRAALEAGGVDNGGPGARELYHPHYYGAFVLDLDGHNVEAVIHRPEPGAG
jgi:catechol 2,3-dioxygenase-like lactoylglutathione lyase family enzyme